MEMQIRWGRWGVRRKRGGRRRQGVWAPWRAAGLTEEGQRGQRIGTVVLASALAAAAVCLPAGGAAGRTAVSARELEGYYQELERGLVEDTREFLDREGFPDSGVMLTRVVDRDGSRQYTLMVHHGRIDRMCEEDRQLLMEEFKKIVFEDEQSVIFHKFYVYQ